MHFINSVDRKAINSYVSFLQNVSSHMILECDSNTLDVQMTVHRDIFYNKIN